MTNHHDMKNKLLYHAPQVFWSVLVANDIICYSTEIDEYNWEDLTW